MKVNVVRAKEAPGIDPLNGNYFLGQMSSALKNPYPYCSIKFATKFKLLLPLAIISLISDFGNDSPYIGVAKAKLHDALPSYPVIDHSHEVESGDLSQAAFLIQMLRGHCSPGSIHILAVETEDRLRHPQILLGSGFGQFFISYNHGLLSLILSEEQSFLNLGSYTGDHFNMIGTIAPNLAMLSNPDFLNSLQPVSKSDFIVKRALLPALSDNTLIGHVVHTDRNGNLFTNISKDDLARFAGSANVRIILSRHEYVDRMVEHSAHVEPGETACYFSEIGMLVIAIPRGHAGQLLGIRKHGTILIEKK